MSCCTQNAAELLRINSNIISRLRMNKEDRDYYGVISFFYALVPNLAVERMIGYVSRQKDSYDMNHHEQSCISSIADDKEDVKNKAWYCYKNL